MSEMIWRQAVPVVLILAALAVFIVPLFRWRQPPPSREPDNEPERLPKPTPSERAMALAVVLLFVVVVLLPFALWLQSSHGLRAGWLTNVGGALAVLGVLRPTAFLAPLRAVWRRIGSRNPPPKSEQ